MKTFNFSLEKVLEVRAFNQRQSEIKLGEATAESTRLKMRLQDLAQKRLSTSLKQSSSNKIENMIAIEHYILWLDKEKEKTLKDLASAELLVEKRRKELNEAMKQRKVLEKLKEKQFFAYRKEMYKKEEQEIDDIAKNKK
ncbi:MAG: flagellar export protein FliJ [Treponema sp. CETP13]|nr:MAG: flagellar export protein FliJ [Treponema sp. CETP13]